MTFLDRLTSAYRFLTQEQRAFFSPTTSEQAVRTITNRMGAKAPEFAK